MRKYRGYSEVLHTWLYGDAVAVADSVVICKPTDFEFDGHHIRQVTDEPLYVNESSVGEFIGKKDINGKEIYLGDIVAQTYKEYNGQITPDVGEVRYDEVNARFYISKNTKYGEKKYPFRDSVINKDGNATICLTPQYEVLGNVYENSEILETIN